MEDEIIDHEYNGKVIAEIRKGQVNGYDTLVFVFTDQTGLIVQEEGQCGYFSIREGTKP